MSRTYRKSSRAARRFFKKDIVPDGTFTRSASSCENHGRCPYCLGNRMHKHRKQPNEHVRPGNIVKDDYES